MCFHPLRRVGLLRPEKFRRKKDSEKWKAGYLQRLQECASYELRNPIFADIKALRQKRKDLPNMSDNKGDKKAPDRISKDV